MGTSFSLRASNGREYPVTGRLRVGRAPESNILLADELVSRLHARVWVENDRLLIRDERSSNGTIINGRALKIGDVANLRPGDTIRVGATTLTVIATAEAQVQPPPAPAAPAAAPAAPLGATVHLDSMPVRAAPAGGSRSLLLAGCLLLVLVALLAVCGALGFFAATAGRPLIATALAPLVGAAAPGAGSAIPATPTPGATASAFSDSGLSAPRDGVNPTRPLYFAARRAAR